MADIEVESTCEEGYTVESIINGEWELIVDALSENGPSPNEIGRRLRLLLYPGTARRRRQVRPRGHRQRRCRRRCGSR